jgi:uncharacterized protein
MKHALILHAWYNHPADHWYPWLKKELENKGYTVAIPELPTMNTDLPDLEKQLSVAETYVSKDTTVIGHSLGALLAMRLAEKYSYEKMLLVAGWDFNDLTAEHRLFWKTPIDHAAIKQHVKNTIVISSDNDPYITAITAEDMSKRLGGEFVLVKDAGHFTKKYGITKIPGMLPYL